MNEVIKHILDLLVGFDLYVVLGVVVLATILWVFTGAKKSEQKKLKGQICVVAFVVFFGVLLIAIHHLIPPRKFPPNVTGVLVLKLNGDTDGALRRQLLSSLQGDLAKEQIDETIEVRGCDEIIDETSTLAEAHKRAREIGEKFGAELVLWGNKAGESRFFPRLTVVRPRPVRRERALPVQDIHEIELPVQTANQSLFLAHFLAGFSYFTLDTSELALKQFEAARELSEPASEDWAIAQGFIGTIHSILAEKKGLEFPTKAIEELSSSADFFQRSKDHPEYTKYYLAAEDALGMAYAQLGKGRDVNRSIAAYQAALTVCSESNYPSDWAFTQNGLGTDYCELKTDDGFKNAIVAFQNALHIIKKDTNPDEWSTVETGLGYAYANLTTGEIDENVERAIFHCTSALTVATETNRPVQWADAQHSLGIAYLNLRRGDKGTNINQAILCFQATLRVQTKAEWPLGWADTQVRLSEAYLELPTGDWLANLKQAIAARELALTVYTEEKFPEDWATTQADLGKMYLRLPDGSGATNALIAATNALKVLNEKAYPTQWAESQCTLAFSYTQLAVASTNRIENLKSAIVAFQAALKVFTEKDYPMQWATVQMHCGTTFALLRQFAEARECFTAALCVIDEQASASMWAEIQYRLGTVCELIPTGNRILNLSEAKTHIQNALKTPSFGNPQIREIANKTLDEIEKALKNQQPAGQ